MEAKVLPGLHFKVDLVSPWSSGSPHVLPMSCQKGASASAAVEWWSGLGGLPTPKGGDLGD